MKSERILELIARKTGRVASEEELEELERLLAEDPDNRFMETVMNAVGHHTSPEPGETEIVAGGWERMEAALQSAAAPARRKPRYWWAAAAVLLLATAAGGMWWHHHMAASTALAARQHHITAPLGSTLKAVLPDGSTIWLNAGSKLSYDDSFAVSSRNVTVSGEVFFDVTKDDNKPFTVHSENLAIQVLGTSFNIRAYGDDKKAEVAVITGKVQVMMCNSPEKKVVLLPREKLVLSLDKVAAPKHGDSIQHATFRVQELADSKDPDVVMETAWCNHKLAFMNETFEEVARKMERQFNVNIVFEDDQLKKEILSGVFEKEDINKALQLLQMTTGFHYRITHQQVYLSKKEKQ